MSCAPEFAAGLAPGKVRGSLDGIRGRLRKGLLGRYLPSARSLLRKCLLRAKSSLKRLRKVGYAGLGCSGTLDQGWLSGWRIRWRAPAFLCFPRSQKRDLGHPALRAAE